jgi:hypothetical protein
MQLIIHSIAIIEEYATYYHGQLYRYTLDVYICHSRCFGIRGGHGKSAFKLAVKLSVELGYVFLSLRL